VVASSTSSEATAGAGGATEPPGASKLTLVNGIVDEDAVRFCFVKHPAGPTTEVPWPSAAGLAFARGALVEASVVPAMSDVEIRAITGTAAAVGNKNCAELSSAPPVGVAVHSLGVLPANVVAEPKSLLLVSYGCVGGPTHTGGLQTLICGQGYMPTAPTVGITAGFMSRLGSAQSLRMQLVHAVLGMNQPGPISVATGIDGSATKLVTSSWSLGAFSPFPPFDHYSLTQWSPLAKAKIQISSFGNPMDYLIGDAFKNSALDINAVKNGEGLVFVAVGAQPQAGEGAWWHKLTFTVVKTDP
jgi:hypothetical protein